MCQSPVLVMTSTDNSKVGKCAVTHVSQSTCIHCDIKDACYGKYGNQAFTTMRLNASPVTSPVKIARAEAEGIRKLRIKKPLRLHIVGDCPDTQCARIVGEAASEYAEKKNMPVWTYTHTRTTPREAWGKVSVLRSCHTLRQCEQAFGAGYGAALLVKKFQTNKKHYIGRGMFGIACPNTVNSNIQCHDCLLCSKDEFLVANKIIILFTPHSGGKKKAMEKAF